MKIRNQIALILTATTIFLLGCSKENKDNQGATSQENAPKLPVDAVIVKLEPLIQEESLAASILPNREVIVTGELSKKVTEIAFKDGSFIERGHLLYKLDDADLVAKHKQLKSEIHLAQLNEQRLSELLKSQSIKQEEYDIAFSRLQSLLANEEVIKSDLQKTNITAPFSGYIGITKAQIGTLVNPGMELVTIQEQGKVRVQFAVPESNIRSIRNGKEIAFTVSGNDRKYSAVIVATEPGFNQQNRSITVHALAENHHGMLKPGMSAKVFLQSAENNSGVALPTEALMPGEHGYNVFRVQNGVAKITSVAIAERNEKEAIISSGVNNGDTIMVSNMLRAGDGVPVQLVTIN